MAADLEEQKKILIPTLQRAEEIQQVEPKVAYYCRLYAVDQALKLPKRAREIDQLLVSTLARLEKDKPSLKLDPASDPAYCEQFAITIFNRADRVDRAGRADAATSKAYYAASVFFEICNQFGELPADIEEKQRYGLWRAAEIRKAIREGRPPLPPASPPDSQPPMADSGIAVDPTASLPDANPADMGLPGMPSTSMGGPSYPSTSGFPDLPSIPTTQSSYPDPPPPAPPTPTAAVPSYGRFRPGDRVLYCESGAPPFHQGTVGKADDLGGGSTLYRVALPTHLVDATDEQLALDAPYGSRVLCAGSPSGNSGPASVLAVNNSSWPPRYLLRSDAGATYDAAAAQVYPPNAQLPTSAPAPPPPASGSGYPTMPHISTTPSAPPPSHPPAPSNHYTPPPSSPPPQPPRATTPTYPNYPTNPTPPHFPTPAAAAYPPPAAAARPPAAAPTPGKPSLTDINEAQKMAKYAASSLAFEDVASAVKYLSDALRLLTKP